MSRLFSIHQMAEIEINEAADFYDFESPGPGRRPTVPCKALIVQEEDLDTGLPQLFGTVQKQVLFF